MANGDKLCRFSTRTYYYGGWETVTGYDTVHVVVPTDNLSILPRFRRVAATGIDKNINIKRGVGKSDPVLYRDTRGKYVRGSVAFINSEELGYRCEIRPRSDWHSDASNMVITMSAATLTGDNTIPCDPDRLREVWGGIVEDLKFWGISPNRDTGFQWLDARVSRVDVARNVELSRVVSAYIKPFRDAHYPLGLAACFDGAHSMRLNIGQARVWIQQWGGYDKGLEVAQKVAVGRAKHACKPTHLGRFEKRLRGLGITKAMGAPLTLADLAREDTFNRLRKLHAQSAQNELLSVLPDPEVLAKNEREQAALKAVVRAADALANDNTPAIFRAKLARIALFQALDFNQAVEFWEQQFAPPCEADSERERKRKARVMQRFKADLKADIGLTESLSSTREVRDLVAELRDALLAN